VEKSLTGQAYPGATVVYVVDVANVGGSPTSAPITVVDTLPPGVVFQQVTAVGWSCAAAPPTVTCTYAPALGPGQHAPPIRITVVVTAPPGTSLFNLAVADSGSTSASGDDTTLVSGPPAPAPLLSPLGLLAALVTLVAVACRRRFPARSARRRG
jgi:uncharacterized repeat protein (TIGR01451 family)